MADLFEIAMKFIAGHISEEFVRKVHSHTFYSRQTSHQEVKQKTRLAFANEHLVWIDESKHDCSSAMKV